ncbi:MAG: nodulation protein NfeD [Candidatus Hydrogenedentota bacterium]|nr:MAG: nodulation protein NfeD [Candidatus Hydrogenedentota bacterium]
MSRPSCHGRNTSRSYGAALPYGYFRPPFRYVSIAAIFMLLTLLLSVAAGVFPANSDASDARQGEVSVIPVHDVIDLGLAFFVKRSLDSAERDGVASIILELNTLGGRVDAALDIRDALEECTIPIAAYVNKRAISAGALICLATGNIAMAPGSTIGAATPIGIGAMGEKQKLGEKEVSYVRGEFRATAERNGHSPLLAEAMVDPDVEVLAVFEDEAPRVVSPSEADRLREQNKKLETEVICAKGKLLTMTAAEAARMGLARSTPASLDEFVRSLDLDPAHMVIARISWSENIVRFLTHPIVSGLLLTLGVLGIFFELQMPGWGISGTLGAILLLLFFGGHYLAGLASFTDVLLFAIGLGLLALELLVVPGFGVTGISGIFCILAGVYLALVRRPIPQFSWDYHMLNTALGTFIFVVVAVAVGTVIIWKMFPDSKLKKLMVLSTSEYAKDGYTASESLESLVGQPGRSLSHLRPAGRALIRGEPLEVQTEGEFIEKDRVLRVVKVVGNKVFVAEEKEGAGS